MFSNTVTQALAILVSVSLLIIFLFVAIVNSSAIQTCIDNQESLKEQLNERQEQRLRKDDLQDVPAFLQRQAN